MRSLNVDKEIFDNLIGLSCVENYLLYILAHNRTQYRHIYAHSFISFYDIVDAFCNHDIQYAYFNKIVRVQELAHRKGLVSLSVLSDISDALSSKVYCCFKVTPVFIQTRFGRSLWRDDHYILACNHSDSNWVFLNDNPRDVIKLHHDELLSVYDGNIICFDILRDFDDNIAGDFLREFKQKLLEPCDSCNVDIKSIEVARDILGVLRISRKRICEYCSHYTSVEFMNNYLMELNKAYAMLEYMRLRNKIDFNKINQELEKLQEEDMKIISLLQQRMGML